MRTARHPSRRTHRPDRRRRFLRGVVLGAALGAVLPIGLSGCAQVDLDELIGSAPASASPSPAPRTTATPTPMVMPSPPPTAQAATAAAVTVGFPDLPGYTISSTATPGATPFATASAATSPAAVTWSRSYLSRGSGCQVSADVTSSPELVVTGGDDRALSAYWADSLAEEYPGYQQSTREEVNAANRSEPYAGVVTTFSASIAGSQVGGRSFVRVWSADGAAVSVTEVCQRGAFDTAAWDAVVHGITVDGLSGQSRWPARSAESSETAETAAPAASNTG